MGTARNYLRWVLISLVISNTETCSLPPNTAFSSALIIRLLAASCSP